MRSKALPYQVEPVEDGTHCPEHHDPNQHLAVHRVDDESSDCVGVDECQHYEPLQCAEFLGVQLAEFLEMIAVIYFEI